MQTTVVVKKVNDVTRLQALVDKKKVVVTKATIRDALRLDDAEGVDCLPNEEIFAELARIGYEKPSTKLTFYKAFFSSQWKFLNHIILQCMSAKRTSWNEFSSSMASVVICLSLGKGFSGVKTPLFEGMVVAKEVGEGVADEVHDEGVPAVRVATEEVVSTANDEAPTADEEPSIPSPTPPTPPPQPSHDIPSTSQRINTSNETVMDDVSNQGRMIADMDADADVVLEEAKDVQDADVQDNADIQGRTTESQAEIYKIDLDHANKVLSMQEEESKPAELQEVVDIVTTANIITEVAASTTITAADVFILAATTVAAPTLTVAPSKRTNGVVIRDPKESTTTTSTIVHSEAKSKDRGKGILVEEPKPLNKQAQIEQDEKYARELEAELNRTIYWDEVIDHVNKKAKEDPTMKEQIDEEESRALKRINETLAEKATKKKKLDEEVEDLKRYLQIVSNEDDDVYTEATHLARKVSVVDYEIYNENNKPYFKIKRADAGYTCSNLEKSKKCSWSSKSQELEAVGILWCTDNHIYNNTADFVSREEVSTYQVHSQSNVK
nr:hypothetical protein [Tanacetum cinerariifolium]